MSESVDRYLDGTYSSTNPGWHESDAPWKAQRVDDVLASADVTPSTVCDIGCGTGGVLDELLRRRPGITATGYEISREARDLAPPHRRARVEICASIEDGRAFDVALLLDVFEHVEDYYTFLRSCRKKAGIFVFHVPLDLHAVSVLRPRYLDKLRELIGHIHYFTAETALATLRATGYDPIHHELGFPGIDRPVTTAQRIMRWPRRLLRLLSPGASARVLGGATLWVVAAGAPAGPAEVELRDPGSTSRPA